MGALADFIGGKGQFAPSGTRPTARSADSVQARLPVQDVERGVMVRGDGALVAVVRVEPSPFGLLSERERERRVSALHEAIQALPGAVQIAVLPRPIDLDGYLSDLEQRLREADGPRRALLRGYAGYVRALVGSGEALERRYYVLVPMAAGEAQRRAARDELLQRVAEFVAALGRAELQARICGDQEITDMLFAWLHPAQAAFERGAEPVAAPRYVPAEVHDAPH